MNLLKALEGISHPQKPFEEGEKSESDAMPHSNTENKKEPAAATPADSENFNAMQSVLERHEAIANRVKNGKRYGKP